MRSYEYFDGKEKKNLIRIHYRLSNLVRVGGDVGEFFFSGEGGRLSFRDADVVLFTFDLDFPEGLSCRE